MSKETKLTVVPITPLDINRDLIGRLESLLDKAKSGTLRCLQTRISGDVGCSS